MEVCQQETGGCLAPMQNGQSEPGWRIQATSPKARRTVSLPLP